MNECSSSRKNFIAALMQWMSTPESEDKSGPPEMVDFGLCRACGVDMFVKIAEMNMAYAQDLAGIVHATQDQLEEIRDGMFDSISGAKIDPPKDFKH